MGDAINVAVVFMIGPKSPKDSKILNLFCCGYIKKKKKIFLIKIHNHVTDLKY